MSFFDHFPGTTLDARWVGVTAGSGTVTVGGSEVRCNCPATTDSAFIYTATKVPKTPSLWLFCCRFDLGSTHNLFVINKATAPTADTLANIDTLVRLRCVMNSTTSIRIQHYDGAHALQSWNTSTNTWGAAAAAISPATTGNYYVIGIEVEATRFRFHAWVVDATGFSTVPQALVQIVLTDWVNWASIESSGDLWIVLGKPYTDSLTADFKVEWARLDDGAKFYGWCNGRNVNTIAGNNDERMIYSYLDVNNRPTKWIPQDRTTVAIAKGTAGQWDDSYIKDSTTVLATDGTYVKSYGGVGTNASIGIATATSPDGPWTKDVNNPILAGGGADPNRQTLSDPIIFEHVDAADQNRRWNIVYTGISATPQARIYLATAPNYTGPWTDRGMILDVGPAGVAITSASRTANLVTITTSSAHGFTNGTIAQVLGVTDASFDGSFTITVTGSTTFTYSQTAANASSSGGNTYQFDVDGYFRARPLFYHNGLWHAILSARNTHESGGAGRLTYATGPAITNLTPSHLVMVDSRAAEPKADVTANVTASRTVSVNDSAGFVADGFVTFDQDATNDNWIGSRVRAVTAGQLELYHKIDGALAATPCKVRGGQACGRNAASSYYKVSDSVWVLYTHLADWFWNDGATYGCTMIQDGTWISTNGPLGPYTLDEINSPPHDRHNFGWLRVAENMSVLGAAITTGITAPTTVPSLGGTGSIVGGEAHLGRRTW